MRNNSRSWVVIRDSNHFSKRICDLNHESYLWLMIRDSWFESIFVIRAHWLHILAPYEIYLTYWSLWGGKLYRTTVFISPWNLIGTQKSKTVEFLRVIFFIFVANKRQTNSIRSPVNDIAGLTFFALCKGMDDKSECDSVSPYAW